MSRDKKKNSSGSVNKVPRIPIQSELLDIHGVPTLQPTGLKGSPSTLGYIPQSSCVYVSTHKSRVWSMMSPPWIVHFQVHPMDAEWDLDLNNFEANSTHKAVCHVRLTVPEQFLWCGITHCPAQGTSFIRMCHCTVCKGVWAKGVCTVARFNCQRFCYCGWSVFNCYSTC